MKTSAEGSLLIDHYEANRLVAYPDPKTGGDPWTVGRGATGPGIGRGTVWTEQQSWDRFVSDIAERERMLNAVVEAPVSQGMFDALISILFNVGAGSSTRDGIIRLKSGAPSSLLRLTNAMQYDAARAEFEKWVSPGSNVEYGLKRRRRAEQGRWDGLSARDAIAVSEAEFPLDRRH